MALTDKNIVIVPSIGASTGTNPRILFTGGDVTSSATITLSVYNSGTQGTLSFSGNSGQLFSIVDTMSGSIFSVNDISGIPSIEVLDTGLIKLAQYNGSVAISTSTAVSGYELSVFGGTSLNGNNQITGITTVTNTTQATSTSTGALQIAGGVGIAGNLWVGGTINATIQGTISTATNANNIATVLQTANASYFPAFVDTNNATSAYELLYTTSSFAINPQSGNVGIGLSTASTKLQVQGNVLIGGDGVTNYDFKLQRLNGGIRAVQHDFAAAANSPWILHGESLSWTGERAGTVESTQAFRPYYEAFAPAVGYKEFGFVNTTTGSFTGVNLIPNIALTNTGNVGIGTTSPGRKLQVSGDGILIDNGASSAVIEMYSLTDFRLQASSDWQVYDVTSTATRLVISSTGNVGIGLTVPDTRLHVSGGARITGITTVTNSTAATSTTTGALQVVGGVGIGGNLYVGGEIVAQKLTIQLTTVTTTLIETDDIIKTTNVTQATATATGALQVAGGASVGGNLWVGGTIIGNIAATVNTASNANNVATVLQTANASYFPAFVDSNNATSAYELLYTTSSFSINPQTGFVGIGTSTPSSLYAVDVVSTSNAIIRAFGTSIGRLSLQNSTRHYSLSVQGGTLFFFDETGGTARAVISSAGNVGIGTSSPGYTLDVAGAISMHDEAQDLDSRYYAGTYLRGWSSFSAGSESNITYATTSTSPVGTEILSVSTSVWARGPRIRLDRTQNYEVEMWIRKTAGSSAGTYYMVVSNWDANGNIIGGDGTDWHYPVNNVQTNLTTGTWVRHAFVVGPYGGTKNHNSTATYISVGFIANLGGGTDTLEFTGFKCHPVTKYNNDALTIANSGNVGIGTTSTVQKITVGAGNILLDNTYGYMFKDNAGTAETALSLTSANNLSLNSPTLSGSIQISNRNTAGSIQMFAGTATGTIQFSAGNQERMRITSGGSVGIGTNSPSSLLHISNGFFTVDRDDTALAPGQVTIRSITSSSSRLYIGYNTASNYGSIQAITEGVAFRNLTLNPGGGNVGIGIATATSLLHVAGTTLLTGVTTVSNTTAATSTVTGALQVVGGVGIQGDLYARNIFSNGSQVVTAASLGTYGVSTLSAGTGTAVSANTGTVTVWVTATLATITANGSTTTATITAGNIFDPYIVDSITQQFDGYTAVFDLRVDQEYINSIVDSKDAEVILNGEQLYPYVDELRWPWHTPYDSYKGFRIVNGITTSSSVQLIIYNAPYIGDSASVTIRTRSTTRKKRKYPFSPATIALGD